jgi:hypothetical protein
MVSRRRLARFRTLDGLPKAYGPWALDSGGFSELQLFGRWETPARQYADEAQLWAERVGMPDFAAIQDWMCEPMIINGGSVGRLRFAGTHLSVPEHQRRTVASYLELRELAPAMPWAPVLQGWAIDDYLACAELYRAAGADLNAAPVVGVGSVCRRQATNEIAELFEALRPLGLRLHGFGLKVGAFRQGLTRLHSCDSMAWSEHARHQPAMPGHTHKRCANCMSFAIEWRNQVIGYVKRPHQGRLVLAEAI